MARSCMRLSEMRLTELHGGHSQMRLHSNIRLEGETINEKSHQPYFELSIGDISE